MTLAYRLITLAASLGILAWAVFEFIDGNIGNGIFITLLSLLVAVFYFISGRNLLAMIFLRREKFDRAAKILDSIKEPEQLRKPQEAYHYFLKGLVASRMQGYGKPEHLFRKALNTGLRLEQDQAVAKLNLAMIYMSQRKKRLAKNLLNEVKKSDSSAMLKENIKMIEQQMKRI